MQGDDRQLRRRKPPDDGAAGELGGGDPATGTATATVFALNRSIDEEMDLTADLRGTGDRRIEIAQDCIIRI